ncbi:hypothetical protein MJH12_18770 [bacterium]|nr:hypothetical protein [bacterium]
MPQNHKHKSIVASSFSSISRKLKGLQDAQYSQFSLLENSTHKEDEELSKDTKLESESLQSKLPKGAVVGTMLHEIFEETDFTAIHLDQDLPLETQTLIQD